MILSPHTSLHPALQVCHFSIISASLQHLIGNFINHFYWNFTFQNFGLTHFLLGLRSMHFINIFFWHQFYTLIHSSYFKKLNSLSLKCILRVREAEVLTDPYWFSVSPKWKKILTFYTVKTRGVSASWREAWNQAVLNLPVCLETKLNARCWFWNNYRKLIDLLTGCVLQWMLSVCLANVRPFLCPCASFALPCRMHVSWHEGSSFLH